MSGNGNRTVRDLLFCNNQDPDQNAIECPGLRPLTYRDLRMQVRDTVSALNALGFGRNDRIAVVSPAGPETAVAIVSAMAGFTVVPLDPHARGSEFDRLFQHLKVRAVIARKGFDTPARETARARGMPVIGLVPDGDCAGKFSLEPAAPTGVQEPDFAAPSDTAILLLTSGTTGTQKVAPVTQQLFVTSKIRQARAFGFTNAERSLHIMPYYHAMGLSTPLLCTWFAGGTVICTTDFIPPDFLPLVREYRPTFYSAGPAVHQAILRELKRVPPKERAGHSLQTIQSATAPLSSMVHRELGELLGVPVTESYGMAEAGMITLNRPPREGSVGLPVIESVTVRDEDGRVLPAGEEGEIVVSGDTVFDGYEDAPEESRAAFSSCGFRTGDIGYLDGDGYLFITGRIKELINKGGEKISPPEIDAALMAHPGIADAMAFPVADPVFGEEVAALVVPKDAAPAEGELRHFLLDRLAPSKIPRRILFTDRIPRTSLGKPKRDEATRKYSRPESGRRTD